MSTYSVSLSGGRDLAAKLLPFFRGNPGDQGIQGPTGDPALGSLDGGTATSLAPAHLIFDAGDATP